MASSPLRKAFLTSLLLGSLCCALGHAQDKELRAVWMTPRTPAGLWSQADLAAAFEAAAKARFNTVYFATWSRGWPLWRSKAFSRDTGFAIDPAAGERDLVQEAVLEAHRHGIELVAWMESGFVGWWDGQELKGHPNGPLFTKHPEWLTKSASGTDRFASWKSGQDLWLAHTNPQAQDFLIRLFEEVAREHDLDGIELDHVWYPSADCGYDAATLAAWKKETGGDAPKDPNDAKWTHWRTEALGRFHADAYRALKGVNPHLVISGRWLHGQPTPKVGGEHDRQVFIDKQLSDWRASLAEGYFDGVEVLLPLKPADYRRALTALLESVAPEAKKKLRPGIAPHAEALPTTVDETVDLIDYARRQGLTGHALWAWSDIKETRFLELLPRKAYPNDAVPPYREKPSRTAGLVLDEKKQKRPNGWKEVEAKGAYGGSLYASEPHQADARALEYVADIPEEGTYSVHAWRPAGDVALQMPRFTLHGMAEPWLVTQPTGDAGNKAGGWVFVGNLRLAKGERQKVVSAAPADVEAQVGVGADALLLMLDRRPGTPSKDAAGPKR